MNTILWKALQETLERVDKLEAEVAELKQPKSRAKKNTTEKYYIYNNILWVVLKAKRMIKIIILKKLTKLILMNLMNKFDTLQMKAIKQLIEKVKN